ncbi:MAG: hypothetical protein V3V67_06225 [Myxococcota bacterium]
MQRFDGDLAREVREAGCECGGVLHSARYPRKPRGGPARLGPGYAFRLSFCCAEDGCRRRKTPRSVRFLGRRVYLGAVVVLASALREGLVARRVAHLRELLGVDRRTLRRWREWWQQSFVATSFWKIERGGFLPPLDESRLPASLLERFHGADALTRLMRVLAFLGPLSTTSEGTRRGFSKVR